MDLVSLLIVATNRRPTMFTVAEMEAYYAARAGEYDDVYSMPEWRDEIIHLHHVVERFPRARTSLDLACGTGYWSVPASKTALSITGVDLNASVLAIAREKTYRCPVRFHQADIYEYSSARRLECAVLGFWLSHVDQGRALRFQQVLLDSLVPGAPILAFDETIRPDRNPLTLGMDSSGNRWEHRQLRDGQKFRIIKNSVDPAWFSKFLPLLEMRSYRDCGCTWTAELAIPQ